MSNDLTNPETLSDESFVSNNISTGETEMLTANYSVTQLDIDKIAVTDDRRKIDEESIEDLASSIELYGLIHPIVVSKDFCLVAGNHRLTAFKRLKRKVINAYVMPFCKDSEECRMVELSENTDRVELSKLEKAVAAYELYSKSKSSKQKLLQSKDTLSERNKKLLLTTSAIPEIMKKFDISRSEAYALIDIAGKLVPEAINYFIAVGLADNIKFIKEFIGLNSVQQINLINRCLAKKEFTDEVKEAIKRNNKTDDKPITPSKSDKRDKVVEDIHKQIEVMNKGGLNLEVVVSEDKTYMLKNGNYLIQEFKSLNIAESFINGASKIFELLSSAS